MSEETSFWTNARPHQGHGWMDRGRANSARYDEAHQPAPEPEPITAEPDAVAGLDLQQYAAQRAALGVRSATEFVGLNRNASGFPDAADSILTSEQRAQLGLGHLNHERPGPEPRPRGITAAAMPTSLGGIPMRGVVHCENNSK
jgi:hypothetical protein